MKDIAVFGSVILDMVAVCKKRPKVGETVKGESFSMCHGGKGANVAVAAARLGGKVHIFGCLGEDQNAKLALKNFKQQRVNASSIKIVKGATSGVSVIVVCEGNNAIVVTPGANLFADEKYVNSIKPKLLKCGIIGAQLETNVNAVYEVSKFAKENNIKFVFNPSPMCKYNKEIFENADFVIVNEIEVKEITGYSEKNEMAILKKYPNKLILTKGARGVYLHDGKKIVHVPAIKKAKVMDTTGAGDTFMGAFMLKINEGSSAVEAVKFANVAAGLKVLKLGAQTGMPYLNEVKNFKTDV